MTTSSGNADAVSFAKLVAQNGSAGKLYGRDKEEELLMRAYESACGRVPKESSPSIAGTNRSPHSELVLISGQPGSGKTTLANSLKQAVQKRRGYFVSGKFERFVSLEPYEVFVSALTEYTDQLISRSDPAFLKLVKNASLEAVGSEASLLTDTIPSLERLLGKHNEVCRVYGSAAVNRFRFVFCNFICALTKCSPLVLFLDDLQWADTASLELIRSLLHTPEASLLLIGAHRGNVEELTVSVEPPAAVTLDRCPSDMSNEESAFADMVRDLAKDQDEVQVTKIHLCDFSIDDIQRILTDLFGKTSDETRVLAELVCEQSQGNILYVLQFLRLLLDQKFLTRDEQGAWNWDDDKIRTKLASEATIMDLVRQTIERQPRHLQETLKVASCMGDEIDDSALELVLQTTVGPSLELGVNEGLLVFVSQFGGYRWGHGLIRQTAFEMIPEDERAQTYLKIGRRLWQSSNAMARDKNIFVIISLLNKGTQLMKEPKERYQIASMNLKAGQEAMKVAAFPDASRFLRKGIKLLSPNHWEEEYELSLQLYSASAEVESINGQYELVVDLIGKVLEHARCLNDKLPVYESLIRSMGQQDSIHKVISIGLDVLRQLGEPLPAEASKMAIVRETFKVKLALRGKSNQDLLNLTPMTDKSKIACMRFLNLMFLYSYQGRSPYTTLIAFRSMVLTLKYGLHSGSSTAFALYGLMLCGMGSDVKKGHRFGQLAVSLAEKSPSKSELPTAYFFTGGGIRPWTEPMKEALTDVLWASKTAMEVGDVETSLSAQQLYSVSNVFHGTPISVVEKQILETIQRARHFRYLSVETLSNITLQLIHCWTGRAPNPARLSGSVMNFDETMAMCKETNNFSWIKCLYWYAMELAYMFGDFEFAGETASLNSELMKFPSVFYATVGIRFIEGLIAVALIRKDVDVPSNWKTAKESLRKMTKWAKDSPRSYAGKQKLLAAEILSLNPKKDAGAVYTEAIELMIKEGYTNDAAVACERAGDYKALKNDTKLALVYWNRSTKLYNEWGATVKAQRLQERISQL